MFILSSELEILKRYFNAPWGLARWHRKWVDILLHQHEVLRSDPQHPRTNRCGSTCLEPRSWGVTLEGLLANQSSLNSELQVQPETQSQRGRWREARGMPSIGWKTCRTWWNWLNAERGLYWALAVWRVWGTWWQKLWNNPTLVQNYI